MSTLERDTTLARGPDAGTASNIDRDPVVPPPSWTTVMRLARIEGLEAPAPAGKMVGLGANRHVAPLRMRVDGESGDFVLVFVILEQMDEQWSRVSALPVHTWPFDDERIAVSLFTDDYDRDGVLEIMARYRFILVCPGGGNNLITHMVLVEVANESKVALKVEIKHEMDNEVPEVTHGTLRHDDVDDDGDLDVVITYLTEDYDDESGRIFKHENENRFLFEPSTQSYREDTAAPNRYLRTNCDW